jgi:IS5 family transposase
MLGSPKRLQPKLFYQNISLEDRVSPGHLLRRVRQTVDFDFVRREVADLYGECGHESLDPAVLMKLMLLLFLENVSSERALTEQLPCRLDWLWFCEYDLDEETPNHSVLSKARRRWGLAVFSDLFQRVLQQCVAAGLVDGKTLHVDASLIRANADVHGLHPALRVAAGTLYERLEQEAEGREPSPAASPEAAAKEGDDGPPLGKWVSSTDPEARLTCKGGQSILGYKDHRVVDDRVGIITATVTTDAATAESYVLETALEQHEENIGVRPRTVVADKGYGTAAVYESLAKQGVTPCIPHKRHQGGHGADLYQRGDFSYDAGRDAYLCPQGQWLARSSTRSDGSKLYQAAAAACAACSSRGQCTRAKSGRRLFRFAGQKWIDWADGCWSREHRRRLSRRRMFRAEGSFADAANRHGYKRARWRGLVGLTIQNLLIAAAQNLRKLLRASRRRTAVALCSVGLAGRQLTIVRQRPHRWLPSGLLSSAGAICPS